ncbi:MAG: hypothetical protein HKO53_09515 [Gemmatimonadetes bacterium]|nr:hypothetical protein [Gemmatimonadota bacterium]
MDALAGEGRGQAMDSDVKRRILSMNRAFDEGQLGFSKFSQFLAHAEERGVVALKKLETGNYEVSRKDGATPEPPAAASGTRDVAESAQDGKGPTDSPADVPSAPSAPEPGADSNESRGGGGLMGFLGRLGPRRGERTARRPVAEVVEIPPEQTRTPPATTAEPTTRPQSSPAAESSPDGGVPGNSASASPPVGPSDAVDLKELGLPSSPEAMTSYLANRYRGVGQKTAETLVASLGTGLFDVLQNQPDRVKSLVGESRAEQVLAAWREDHRRRVERVSKGAPAG